MANSYDKIATALKEIKKLQDLISQGLAKPPEKSEAFRIAKEATDLFADDIFKRRAEKLGKITIYSKQSRDGFVAADEAGQLDDWIALLEEYLDKRKIHSDLSSEKTHIHSTLDGEDQHVYITEKGSKEHAHLIVDHRGTRELIRVDQNDQAPQELIKSVRAELELKNGDTVEVTKSGISFVEPEKPEPDVRVYSADKDGYFVLEIYNNGDEDLEDFRVQVNWLQPEGAQERVLEKFNDVTDYLVMAHPRSLNMLASGTRVYANGVPSISVDKKLKVTVTCKGMRSGKKIEKIFNLETKNQY